MVMRKTILPSKNSHKQLKNIYIIIIIIIIITKEFSQKQNGYHLYNTG